MSRDGAAAADAQLDLVDEPPERRREDLALAAALSRALLAHDRWTIGALLALPAASRLPRAVREEAELFARLPRGSLRAPMQALLHERRLAEAAR